MKAAIVVLAAGGAALLPILMTTMAPPGRPANPGFDTLSGWRIEGADPADGYTLALAPGEHGKAARFASDTARPGQGGMFVQTMDAAPWRGKDIEFTARLRVDGKAKPGLVLSVTRPEPNATGFRDQGGVTDVPVGRWFRTRALGHVDADALTVNLGVALTGRGAVLVDDVTLAEATLPATPPSAEASTYLDRALAIIRQQHLRTREMDWPALEARAHREIAGAQVPRETYWAIRGVLGTLGDHHSFLASPQPGAAKTAAQVPTAPAAPMPMTRLVDGRFGLVALPQLNTFGPTGGADGVRYAAVARAGLRALDARPLCGWIVDLREDGGGNMWPMLNGVSPLLGASPFGAFIDPNGRVSRWLMRPGGVSIEGTEDAGWPVYPPFQLRQAGLPVAVLTSGSTASSGEAVTLAFSGRPGARRFGTATAGFTTGNSAQALSDGAVLAVAGVWERDRTGRDYRERIEPEEATTCDGALPAALRWLDRQCATKG